MMFRSIGIIVFLTLFQSLTAQFSWLNPVGPGSQLNSVFFVDQNTGYAPGETGTMLKTIDGGTSWSVLKTGTTNRIISVYFSDPLKGCALMEKGVLKTSDGGKSWSSIAISTSLDLRSFCFTDGLTGYAVGDGYLSGLNHGTIYKTTNGGSSWTPVCETNHGFWSVYFFDSGNGYAMGVGQSMSKTSDGGLTWSEIPFKEGIPSLLLTSCDFIDSHTGFAAGISGYNNTGLIYKTLDGGKSWSISLLTAQRLTGICFITPSIGFIIDFEGSIRRTTDGGTTWNYVYTATGPRLITIYFKNLSSGFAVGEGGTILETTDGGTTWNNRNSVTGNHLNSVYFTDTETGYTVGAGGVVLKTANGGNTWTRLSVATENKLISVLFTSPATGYISGARGTILKTVDYGQTWISLLSGTTNDINAICFIDANTGYAAGNNGTLLKTTNGGIAWLPVSVKTDASLFSLCFTDAQNGFAVGSRYTGWHTGPYIVFTILKTIDGGANWTDMFTYPGWLNSVTFPDPETGYVAGSNGLIFKTYDAGINWSMISGSQIPNSIYDEISSVFFTDSKTGYVVGKNGVLSKTNDGGTTWISLPPRTDNYFRSVFFITGKIGFVAGDNGSILKTINGGEENSNSADWHIDENTEIVIFPNPARSNLTITGINQNSIISIYDMAGNLKLFQIIVDNKINVGQLIPGIYILRIIDHNKVVLRKIVRE